LVADFCAIVVLIGESEVAIDVTHYLKIPRIHLLARYDSNPEIVRVVHVGLEFCANLRFTTITISFTSWVPLIFNDFLLKSKPWEWLSKCNVCNLWFLILITEVLVCSVLCVYPGSWSLTE
jgi:hypothetical protein